MLKLLKLMFLLIKYKNLNFQKYEFAPLYKTEAEGQMQRLSFGTI
jgi:hypothetical protein